MQRIQPRESAHQACEHVLRRAVLTGELKPGQRLAPERTLAEQLGVSRLTLRAALAALTAQGLLAVRQGSGYVVQDIAKAASGGLLAEVANLAAERGELAPIAVELLRVRRHLARAVLEHLVEHPPKAAAVRAFDAAVDAMDALVAHSASVDELAEADLAIIAALLDATASPVLRLCINPVIAVVTTSPRLRAVLYAEPATNVAAWRGVAAWLRKPSRPEALIELLAARDAESLVRLNRRGSR
jgi:DNA-binding FadR family transcriptional regulator